MLKSIRCGADLGLEDCSFVAQGPTPADVVEQVVAHLREEHGLDMPDAGAILEKRARDASFLASEMDPGVGLVVERLRQALDIEPVETPPVPQPTPGPRIQQ